VTRKDKHRLDALSQLIFDKKGVNILVLDVRGISTMTDYCVIAEGSVGRHVKSICAAIKDETKKGEYILFNCEGEDEGDWVVMDCGDIVIHLLTPDMREKYALEELWKKGKIVDVNIDVSRPVKVG
jgi:ribosome-associated protein